jgi:hypothetical protein
MQYHDAEKGKRLVCKKVILQMRKRREEEE